MSSLLPVEPLQSEQSRSPTTTSQQDLVTAGQRRVNLIWESTQSVIAVIVTLAMIGASVTTRSSPELNDAFFLIVGFYFSRTNHTNIGGVGEKVNEGQVYRGR